MRRSTLVAAGLVLLTGAAALTYTYRDTLDLTDLPRGEQVENLRAFATLYGYVRYFHPSDAAANTDWDAFAIHGVRQAKNAANRAELRAELEALFKPIAPTIQLYRTGDEPPPPADVLAPSDTARLNLVAWQHQGIGFSQGNVPSKVRRLNDSLRTYRSIRLNRPPGRDRLFKAHAAPKEMTAKPLGRGLSVQLPLALYGEAGQTLRPSNAPSPSALRDSLSHVETPILKTTSSLRLAGVTIAWNVFQHFYPYFEAVDVDWDAVLTRTFRRALADDTSTTEFVQTLRRMVAQLEDGHGRVHHSQESSSSGLPVRFGRIGDEIVVVDTAGHLDRTLCPDIGDVVVSIGGRPPEQRLQERKLYISGSPQWTEGRALQKLGRGDPGSPVSLTVRRGNAENACKVTRSDRRIPWRQLRVDDRPNTVDTLRAGVRYVDLTRAEWPTLRQHLGELADADGVVFDVRGYPTGGARKLLPHLSSDTLRSARFQVPQFIYPDQANIVGYDASGRWTLPPEEPQITGDVAFLTGPGAISYAESIMGIVEHYELGTIVGRPTAGTNGNVNPFELPGGYKVWWTGMRVRKHDGSQHHLVGIRPDIEAERTIEGVRNGRDEVLEKALEVLRSSKQDSSSERGATASN
ncbi:S41 family peptidase [Salinibacter ruber]|uniref:S41 family peptidase n=1 Tax=Salinibacter ruber TaxID=146919 RepID=UPI00207458B4|nr:S41 family peptidase [Salinibacter ruber]